MKNFSILILSLFIICCKHKPDGKDKKGWFIYRDSCVKQHTVTGLRPQPAGKAWITVPYTYTVCDKYITIKEYPNINDLDTLNK